MKTALIAVLFAFVSSTAFAHSGGTNSQGCHNNTKTGGYHCH
ncbi:YHYH domain-containing protein [Roseibium sp. MMSF_3247]|nr:YHYH domain-containing protein [Roseibium sp. MMSF_3247]